MIEPMMSILYHYHQNQICHVPTLLLYQTMESYYRYCYLVLYTKWNNQTKRRTTYYFTIRQRQLLIFPPMIIRVQDFRMMPRMMKLIIRYSIAARKHKQQHRKVYQPRKSSRVIRPIGIIQVLSMMMIQ